MVAGLTASGKTSLARELARLAGVAYVSGSALRAQFLDLSHERAEGGRLYWLSHPEALAADEDRLRPDALERNFDLWLEAQFDSVQEAVFDVWFLPWLKEPGPFIRIYVDAPAAIRIGRAANQAPPGVSMEFIRSGVHAKDARATEYARTAYRVDILRDATPFDVIVRSTDMAGPAELAAAVMRCAGTYVSGPRVRYLIEADHSGEIEVTAVGEGSDGWRLAPS